MADQTSYDNTNRGVLFRNDKEGNEKRPDYTGSINVDGVDYYLSAWIKTGKSGKFFSMSVKPKEERREMASSSSPAYAKRDDEDSEIPF